MPNSVNADDREDGEAATFSDEMHVRQGMKEASSMFLIKQMQIDEVASNAACDASIADNHDNVTTQWQMENIVPTNPQAKKVTVRSESKIIRNVVTAIDDIEEKQRRKGFRESKFTFGVLNSLLVAYVFGAFPEHFWLVYLMECSYLIPAKFMKMLQAKPLCEAFYYLDFCWMMNFLGLLSVFFLIMNGREEGEFTTQELRRNLYMATFGIACGPLTGATAILPFVAFLFHDLNTMTNLVIHMMPPMLLYTLQWHTDSIRKAYGSIFDLSYLADVNFFPTGNNALWWWFLYPPLGKGSIAGNAVIVYIAWFIPYTSWMLLFGLELPRQRKGKNPKFDTVFHSLWRAGPCELFGTLVWKRERNLSLQQMRTDDYELRDFMLYMTMHAVCAVTSIPVLARLASLGPSAHGAILLVLLVICVHRGSVRYTYYVTEMYGDGIRKQFLAAAKSK